MGKHPVYSTPAPAPSCFRAAIVQEHNDALFYFLCFQADELLAGMDRDGDGTLDYVEFLSAFKIVDTKTGQSSQPLTMLSATPAPRAASGSV